LPAAAVRLLTDMLTHLADGRAVTVIPEEADLTTQQAADMLNVSRPYFVQLLGRQEIPFRMVGTHRRVKFRDVLAYQQAKAIEQRKALDDLAAEAQELGLGY